MSARPQASPSILRREPPTAMPPSVTTPLSARAFFPPGARRLPIRLLGSNNGFGTVEVFAGFAGNDTINGRGGFDRADYNNDPTTTSGITVHLAAGTVTGDATVGTDTLLSVEAVRGTNFADTYDATGFRRHAAPMPARSAPSTNSPATAATTPSSATAIPGSASTTRPRASRSTCRPAPPPAPAPPSARRRRCRRSRHRHLHAASTPSRLRCSTITLPAAPTTTPSPALAATTSSTAAAASIPSATTTSTFRPAGSPSILRRAPRPATPRSAPTRCARSRASRAPIPPTPTIATGYGLARRSQHRQQRHLQPVRGPWRRRHHHRQRQHADRVLQCFGGRHRHVRSQQLDQHQQRRVW